jgi:hypothetical protein
MVSLFVEILQGGLVGQDARPFVEVVRRVRIEQLNAVIVWACGENVSRGERLVEVAISTFQKGLVCDPVQTGAKLRFNVLLDC